MQVYKTVSTILNTLSAWSLWLMMYRILNLIYKKQQQRYELANSGIGKRFLTLDRACWVPLPCGCNYLGAKTGRFARQYNHATVNK